VRALYSENPEFGLDFSFASHFLQEEVWPMRAALRINEAHGLGLRANLPSDVPIILSRYRTIAARNFPLQPQLPQAAL
jgi:hypothetical protein